MDQFVLARGVRTEERVQVSKNDPLAMNVTIQCTASTSRIKNLRAERTRHARRDTTQVLFPLPVVAYYACYIHGHHDESEQSVHEAPQGSHTLAFNGMIYMTKAGRWAAESRAQENAEIMTASLCKLESQNLEERFDKPS